MSQSPKPAPERDQSPKKGNRGLSWSVEEDEQLCRSWANINVGGETTTLSMWDRIKDDFHAKTIPRTPRSVSAMRSRWHVIQGSTLKFCEAIAEAESTISDTENGNLVLTEAFKIYRREAKFNEGFNLQHCWTVLRDKQKWRSILVKKATKDAKNAMMVNLASATTSSLPANYRLLQGEEQQQAQQLSQSLPRPLPPAQVPQAQQIPQPLPQQLPQEQASQAQTQVPQVPQTQQQQCHQTETSQIQPPQQPSLPQQQPPSNTCEIILTQQKRKANGYDHSFDDNKKLKLKERKLDLKIMAFDPLAFTDPIRREFFQIQQKEVLQRWKKMVEKQVEEEECNNMVA